MAEPINASTNSMPRQSGLESWLREPWWPASFLRRNFNWKLPLAIGAAAAALVAWLAGGEYSSFALLGSINLVVYAGTLLAVALLVVWKAKTERGQLIACDLAAVLIVLLCLLPGSWLGRMFLDQRLASTKAAAEEIVPALVAHQAQQGSFPQTLTAVGGAPSAPMPIEYSTAPGGGQFRLSVPDPSCLLSCSWVYDREGKTWVYLQR